MIDKQAIAYFFVNRCFDSKQTFLLSWMTFYLRWAERFFYRLHGSLCNTIVVG